MLEPFHFHYLAVVLKDQEENLIKEVEPDLVKLKKELVEEVVEEPVEELVEELVELLSTMKEEDNSGGHKGVGTRLVLATRVPH